MLRVHTHKEREIEIYTHRGRQGDRETDKLANYTINSNSKSPLTDLLYKWFYISFYVVQPELYTESESGRVGTLEWRLCCANTSSAQPQLSYSLLCFCFSFCFIFIVLPHSTRLPFFPLYRLALYLNRLELSRLVVPLSLPSLSLSRCLCPCFRVLSPPHPAPTHSLTLNNGCLLCAVFFFFLLFAAASSSSSYSATSDSAASVGAALGDLGLREIFVHRHHYHQVAWFVGFERRVPPLCAECAPYLLYLALPRVSISLHLGIFPPRRRRRRRRGPMFPIVCAMSSISALFYYVLFCFFEYSQH